MPYNKDEKDLASMRYGLLMAVMMLAGCGGKVPCGICYEDEWSREPFPGQEKVYSPTVDLRKTQPEQQGDE